MNLWRDQERTYGDLGRRVSLRFVPQDLWVGVYWRTEVALNSILFGGKAGQYGHLRFLVVYITLVPMLPLRVWFRLRPRWELADGTVEEVL